MANHTLEICPVDQEQLERPNWCPGMVVTDADLTAEQEYFRQKQRRHNFYLHGWGVVCGLEVTATPTVEQPWCIRISKGYALGPYGDEIFVPEPVDLDLATCIEGATTGSCEPSPVAGEALSDTVYIAISYIECLKAPGLPRLDKCGCPEEACEYSRRQDSYKISCLGAIPSSHQDQVQRLCDILAGDHVINCPSCPDDGYVVLAEVTLPGPDDENAELEIDNMTRLPLASTRILQEQLEACCCEAVPVQPLVAPDDLRCRAVSTTEMSLSWSGTTGEYQIRRSEDEENWEVVGTSPTINYIDRELTPGTTYHYEARSYRETDDNYSEWSDEAVCTTHQLPVLAWITSINPSDESSFTVYEEDSGTGYTEMAPENIVVNFSKALSEETVNATTIIVHIIPSEYSIGIGGEVSYQAGELSATFVPDEGFVELVSRHVEWTGDSAISLRFYVTVSGTDGIVDEEGFALDADHDGYEGGTFRSSFNVAIVRLA